MVLRPPSLYLGTSVVSEPKQEFGLRTYLTTVGLLLLLIAAYLFIHRMSVCLGGRTAAARVLGHELPKDDEAAIYLRDPQVACIHSFLHMWAAPLLLAVLGGAALAVLANE
jgi:hypothetical protein